MLRDGVLVGKLDKAEITHDRMVQLMIGRDLKVALRRRPTPAAARRVLGASGIRTARLSRATTSISTLHAGEILGLAGLVGSGRTELARALFGIDARFGGTVSLDGAPVALRTASRRGRARHLPRARGPQGRRHPARPVDRREHLAAQPRRLRRGGLVAPRQRARAGRDQPRANSASRRPTVATRTGSLSGGNQQKVVLAKWLAMQPKVMIFDEPTRGIDVGAKAEIYRLMRGLADAGVAVLMISSDMEEVIGVSDRIAVMHEGRISGILERADFTEENVLTLAIGKPLRKAG